jgi:hypothetical protein
MTTVRISNANFFIKYLLGAGKGEPFRSGFVLIMTRLTGLRNIPILRVL